MRCCFFLMLFFIASVSSGQLVEKRLIVPTRFQNVFDSSRFVKIPEEYEISVFYAGGLKMPRFMTIGPNGSICVADMNAKNIISLLDTDGDGVCDSIRVIAPTVDIAHSLAFYDSALYVAEPSRVRKFLDLDRDGYYETEMPFITGIGSTGVYNHYTRTILFDTLAHALYLSVGASCNACREVDSERGTILRFNADGSGRSIYATGLRNAVGLAFNPWSGSLWATNADRDGLGDYEPEESITSITADGFYGWPFAYGQREWDNFQNAPAEFQAMLPLRVSDSSKVATMKIADVHIPAHSTPLGILFYHDPRTYIPAQAPTALIAVHGSSPAGKPVAVGYKVIKMVYDSIARTWNTFDFITGFLTDSVNYKFWGRPCGLIQDSAGDIYLSTDIGIPAIYRISLKRTDVVQGLRGSRITLSTFPNPTSSFAKVMYTLPASQHVRLQLIDELGRVVQSLWDGIAKSGPTTMTIATERLVPGAYYIEMNTTQNIISNRLIVIRSY